MALVLANIFMGFYQSKWLNENNLNKTKFYLRYVADILAGFNKKQDSLIVLSFLNKVPPNTKFTIEIDHSIASLNVLISDIDNQNPTL